MNILWLAAAVIFAVAEFATFQFVSIWFALGALAAFFAELAGLSVMGQVTVFVIVAVLLFVLSKPIVKKLRRDKVSTNSDRLIGKTVIISQQVDNLNESGSAKVGGIEWSVRSDNGDIIDKGCEATVKDIQGVKLIVSAKK